jgi:ABC-2 type transport system ATP-binding protein
MHEPDLLIMDDPTVGIDPQSRNHILDMVKSLNGKGKTVIYTSHYMEEVEYLCSRIAIMDEGDIIALGTKEELVSRLIGVSSMELNVDRVTNNLVSELENIQGVTRVAQEDETITIFSDNPKEILGDVVLAAKGKGVAVVSLEVKEPNLETLFLTITGRKLRD